MAELQPKRALTWRALTVGGVLSLLWLLYDCTLAVPPELETIEFLYLVGFGAIFTMFCVHLVNRMLPEQKRLTPQEMVVIYALVAVSVPWGITIRGALEGPMKILVIHTGPSDESAGWLTSVWTPLGRDAQDVFARGGLSILEIPWDEWAIPILYWCSILISFQLFAISVVLFFRRVFIDEEKLPFPQAQVTQGIIDYTPSKSDEVSEKRMRMAIRVAFIVGLLLCTNGIVSITPDSEVPIPMDTEYYSTSFGIGHGQTVYLSWDPFILCFLMFFPLDVLLTCVGLHAAGWILLPFICNMMGWPARWLQYYPRNIFLVGGITGIAFWTLFFSRRQILKGIKRALQGGREPDGADPFSYRTVLIGMVVAFAVFATLFVYGSFGDNELVGGAGRMVINLLGCMVIVLVMLLTVMRMSGEQGFHYHSPWSIAFVVSYVHYHYMQRSTGDALEPVRFYDSQASFLSIGHVVHFGAHHNAFAPHLHVLYALKLASQTQTDTRDVMKAVGIALLLGLIVVIPMYMVFVHHYGFEHGDTANRFENFFNFEIGHHDIGHHTNPSFFNRCNIYVSVVAGLVLIGAVMYLKREVVGFPLSPVGVVMATAYCFPGGTFRTQHIWFAFLLVYIVKLMIYRWFGVGFFRKRVIPVVIFAMMGLMTGMLIYKILFAALGRGFMTGG